jgi:hypothetical protein
MEEIFLDTRKFRARSLGLVVAAPAERGRFHNTPGLQLFCLLCEAFALCIRQDRELDDHSCEQPMGRFRGQELELGRAG